MNQLYSLFSSLTLRPDQIMRIQNWVDLNFSTLTILGNITSGGGWTANNSVIIIGPSGYLNISNLTTFQSNVIINGGLSVSLFNLSQSQLVVTNTAVIDQLYSEGSIIEIQGTVQINSSTFKNTKFIVNNGSIINFTSCVDLSDSTLAVKISSNMTNETIVVLTGVDGCLIPFKSAYGDPQRDCDKATDFIMHYNSTTIWVSFLVDESGCNSENNQWVTILVAVIITTVLIVIIFGVCTYKNPKLRKTLLPYADKTAYLERDSSYTSSEDASNVL